MIELLKDLKRVQAELSCLEVSVTLHGWVDRSPFPQDMYLKVVVLYPDDVKYSASFSTQLITTMSAPESLWEKIIIDAKRP